MSLKAFIKNLFKPRYHFVPPCPRCGSYHTGRYVKTSDPKVDKLYISKANKGELVKGVNPYIPLEYNAYCEECGSEWNAVIENRIRTPEMVLIEKQRRGISEDFREEFEENYVLTKDEKKAAKRKGYFIKGEDDAEEILKNTKASRFKKFVGNSLRTEIPFMQEVTEITLKNKTKKELKEQIDDEFSQYGL